jgi:5-formyltetrahydrofolate cyclo-ligase
MKTKSEIRQEILAKRNSIPESERAKKSALILKELENHPLFQKAGTVLFYMTHGSEVDTLPLIEKTLENKKICLPIVDTHETMSYGAISSVAELVKGKFGLREPATSCKEAIDLIVIPGVAFSPSGTRLGTGKGYYDRFLEGKKHIPKIGLAFKEQILAELPEDPYDVPVDMIITDTNIYNI